MSRFKACGIYSLQPEAILKKLPDSDAGISSDGVQKRVSDAFVKILKSLREVSGDSQPPRRQNAKIKVTSDKGVIAADIRVESSSEDEAGTEVVLNDGSGCSSMNETEILTVVAPR